MRVLVTGWFSFLHGEVTAGDALAADTVTAALGDAGIPYDMAWSPVFRPDGLTLDEAAPDRYSHLVFVCGPIHGDQVRSLHNRYRGCRRIAVGVSVIDPGDPAVTGFDVVLARDGAGEPSRDLAVAPRDLPPVAGLVLARGQGEYGGRRRHDALSDVLTGWLTGHRCAVVPLETRLDRDDWRLCSTASAFTAILRRLDVVITTRLHGLVLALRSGVPALAVDPVDGGAKVTAQARAWDWPVLPADASVQRLEDALAWCLSADGIRAARDRARAPRPDLTELLRELRA